MCKTSIYFRFVLENMLSSKELGALTPHFGEPEYGKAVTLDSPLRPFDDPNFSGERLLSKGNFLELQKGPKALDDRSLKQADHFMDFF